MFVILYFYKVCVFGIFDCDKSVDFFDEFLFFVIVEIYVLFC